MESPTVIEGSFEVVKTLEHKHLLIKGNIHTPPKDTAETRKFLADLVESIGMKLMDLGENQANPIAGYSSDPCNQGMTAAAILTTSHCVLHVWDHIAPAEIQFDLYSCAAFDMEFVISRLDSIFNLDTEKVQAIMLNRATWESINLPGSEVEAETH